MDTTNGRISLSKIAKTLLLHPADGMHILVANFDKQQIVTREEVVSALVALPADHIRQIQVVRYDPLRTIPNTLAMLSETPARADVSGTYYHGRDLSVIVLFRFRSKAEFLHILYHEVGHFVFLRVLRQDQRDIWLYQIRPTERTTVSAYAARTAREDFAETYAVWMTRPDILETTPLRRAFFAEQVFG